ncbi:MAG: hypothetical protein HOD92_15250 [Deltaproteobacteria bacterium]|nr:hypothetical protein [Deltaproteobacteria bacterium]
MTIIDTLFPYIAWLVCIALLTIPALWGAVFTATLFGHLTQLVFKREKLKVPR